LTTEVVIGGGYNLSRMSVQYRTQLLVISERLIS